MMMIVMCDNDLPL